MTNPLSFSLMVGFTMNAGSWGDGCQHAQGIQEYEGSVVHVPGR